MQGMRRAEIQEMMLIVLASGPVKGLQVLEVLASSCTTRRGVSVAETLPVLQTLLLLLNQTNERI
jgi:hypothetical protein